MTSRTKKSDQTSKSTKNADHPQISYNRKPDDVYWMKYCWEFMRRSPEYQKGFNKVNEFLKKNRKLRADGKAYSVYDCIYRFGFFRTDKEVPDPKKSFEEAFKPEEMHMNFIENNSYSSDLKGTTLQIWIDLDKVNSIHRIKKLVLSDIDKCLNLVTKSTDKKKKVRKKMDFDIILQVGDLRKKGLTYQKIAKIMFPRDFNPALDSQKTNPESAISKVRQYNKTYTDLVNGGYEDFTYP